MTVRRLKASGIAVATVAFAFALTAPGVAAAGSNASSSADRALQGTWLVEVTLRDCQSNVALASFPPLLTYAQGGTTVEVPSTSGLPPGQRSNGLGVWKHERRRRTPTDSLR